MDFTQLPNNKPEPLKMTPQEEETFLRILRINDYLPARHRLAHLAFEEDFAAERDLFERAAHIRDYAKQLANS